MKISLGIVMISAAILVFLVLRALAILRKEGPPERGSPPGSGYHEIDASYFSGGGGGGGQKTFHVPRDPQEYARGFVPRKGKRK